MAPLCTALLILSVLRPICAAPNFLIFLADDLGFGDLSVYGHPTSETPNIDQLARDGVRFTNFYAGAAVCSPSRGVLLTGKYHVRLGIYPSTFDSNARFGLLHNFTTIPTALRPAGYRSAIIGKWHLGYGQSGRYLPTNAGFEYYYGIPWSQSECPTLTCFYPDVPCDLGNPDKAPCALFRNTSIIEQPLDFLTLTQRYVRETKSYLTGKRHSQDPFFLLVAFQHVHNPQFAGHRFTNSSLRGKFGDSLLEMDWAVGEIMNHLESEGLLEDTFIMFTSDNGASFVQEQIGGATGGLRCGKTSEFEGGRRVAAIFYWKDKLKPRIERQHFASFMDLLPTLASLAGAPQPECDGLDLTPLLFERKPVRSEMAYYSTFGQGELYAVRVGEYKAHYLSHGGPMGCQRWADIVDDSCCDDEITRHDPPKVYNLLVDPGERADYRHNLTLTEEGRRVLGLLDGYYRRMAAIPYMPSLTQQTDDALEPCCSPGCTPFPRCCHCAAEQD